MSNNVVKEKNFSMLLALKEITTSFYYVLKELGTNGEDDDELKFEEEIKAIKAKESKSQINNLEKMVNNNIAGKRRSNKTAKYKVDTEISKLTKQKIDIKKRERNIEKEMERGE